MGLRSAGAGDPSSRKEAVVSREILGLAEVTVNVQGRMEPGGFQKNLEG